MLSKHGSIRTLPDEYLNLGVVDMISLVSSLMIFFVLKEF